MKCSECQNIFNPQKDNFIHIEEFHPNICCDCYDKQFEVDHKSQRWKEVLEMLKRKRNKRE